LTEKPEELVDIGESSDGTGVIKKVPCGRDCVGYPHGPYRYILSWDGGLGLSVSALAAVTQILTAGISCTLTGTLLLGCGVLAYNLWAFGSGSSLQRDCLSVPTTTSGNESRSRGDRTTEEILVPPAQA
jgi:hypothetical protein